jgi:hypothetical protein
MLNKEELKTKIAKFNAFLQKGVADEPNLLTERLNLMDMLIAESGQYLADAKYYQDEVINGAVMDAMKKQLEEKLSATTINLFVKSSAKDWNHIVNSLERINASATHQHGSIRTRISFIKTTF